MVVYLCDDIFIFSRRRVISDERSCSLVDTVLVRHLVNAAHTNELRVSRDVISETQRVYLCGMLMLQNKFILTDEVCVCLHC